MDPQTDGAAEDATLDGAEDATLDGADDATPGDVATTDNAPAAAPDGADDANPGDDATGATLAKYTAARAFLFAEWLGTLLMLASFTVLYWLVLSRSPLRGPAILAVSILLMLFGTVLYWRSRTIYLGLEFPWRRRWEQVATVMAGAAGIFWLLFLLLAVLVWLGIPLLPE